MNPTEIFIAQVLLAKILSFFPFVLFLTTIINGFSAFHTEDAGFYKNYPSGAFVTLSDFCDASCKILIHSYMIYPIISLLIETEKS